MNSFIRKIAYGFTRKRIDESKLDILSIKLNSEDISYFNLSTNSIISFNYGGKLWYFRECPKVMKFDHYFSDAISRFFNSLKHLGISKEHFAQDIPIKIDFEDSVISSFKDYLDVKMKESGFFKKLSKVDTVSEKCDFSIWCNQTYDKDFFEKFGFGDVPEICYDILVYFLWNMRAAASAYRLLKIVRGSQYSYFSAVRSVSSRIVAEELCLEHMITDAKWCKIETDDGKSVFGLLSDSAPGKRMADIKPEPDSVLQRELNILNALDVICYQTDHGPNNYNVDYDYHICAFDNDNPATFLPIPLISTSLAGCAPLADKKGRILRPFLDSELADALNSLDRGKLRRRLKPYLNFLQIVALFSRINKLKRAVNKTRQADELFLLDREAWNSDTVKEELSGKYGITYLTKALKL